MQPQQGLRRLGSGATAAAAAAGARAARSHQQAPASSGRLLPQLTGRRPATSSGGSSSSSWRLVEGSGGRHPVLGAAHCARGLASVPADLGKGVDILAPQDGEAQQRTYLLGYDGRGFEVRDINFRGSILAFPNACFLWRARTVEDITPEALAPILMVKPPIEIVIVGAGEKLDRPMPQATVDWLAKQGVAVEQMDTSSACATFNILNQEDRRVVGALLAVDEEYPPAGGASP